MDISSVPNSIISDHTPHSWVFSFQKENVFGVIEIEDADGNASGMGEKFLQELNGKIRKPLAKLEDIHEIIHHITKVHIVSLLIGSTFHDMIHIGVYGAGVVYIKRGNVFTKLIDHAGGLSGVVKQNDVFVFLTKTAALNIKESELHESVDTPIAQLEQNIQTYTESHTFPMGTGIVFFPMHPPTEYNSVFKPNQEKPFPLRKGPLYLVERMQRGLVELRWKLKDTNIRLSILLLSIFLISVGFGIHKEVTTKHDISTTNTMADAKRLYEEGEALLELNPVKGRERLSQAQKILEPLKETVTSTTKEGRQVIDLYNLITKTLTQAMHIYTVEPQLFYDASLLKLGGSIQYIARDGDTVVLGDTTQKAVYILSLSTKTGSIVAGGDIYTGLQSVAMHGSTIYALFSDFVAAIDTSTKQTKQGVIKKNDAWGTITDSISFGGNIYLLDIAKSRVWKYMATASGFSDMKEYLNPDTLPDLTKATNMSIDGSLWIATYDGKILRFTQGKENPYVPQGLDMDLQNDLLVYTSDDTKYIYVLDKKAHRVVVLDKDGIYLAQYVFTATLNPTRLLVSEMQHKILLLDQGKLYSIELK